MQNQIIRPQPQHRDCKPIAGKKLMVEGINLLDHKIRCDSEDGQLRKVIVQEPDYLNWDSKSAINPVEAANNPPNMDMVKREHAALVDALLAESVGGISVKAGKESPEGVYQRDSLAVVGSVALKASFLHTIRKNETSIIRGAISPWKDGGVAEFGDFQVFPSHLLVGVGDRTNIAAVETLQGFIHDREIYPIPLKPGTLHLDYATTIGGRGKMRTMIVCPDLYGDPSMINELISILGIQNTIVVPKDNYFHGWTNVFYINPETVVSTTAAHDVNVQMRKLGFKVHEIPFDGILTGEGAPRCCTAPILRDD